MKIPPVVMMEAITKKHPVRFFSTVSLYQLKNDFFSSNCPFLPLLKKIYLIVGSSSFRLNLEFHFDASNSSPVLAARLLLSSISRCSDLLPALPLGPSGLD